MAIDSSEQRLQQQLDAIRREDERLTALQQEQGTPVVPEGQPDAVDSPKIESQPRPDNLTVDPVTKERKSTVDNRKA